ncbi:MAG: cytochrome c oxidase assembly protein [Rhizobiaceae bacterium]
MAQGFSIPTEMTQTARRGHGFYVSMAVLGTFLWWMSTYRMSEMPFWAPWDFSPLWFIAMALAVYWYARGLACTPSAERPALWRTSFYYAGVVLIWIVLQTRFEYMAQHMFFLNRAQHVVMHHIGPFLIALAWPGEALTAGMPDSVKRLMCWRPLKAVVAIVQQPFLAAVLFFGLIALWLTPSIHFRAMIDPELYTVMNWSMVVDGLFFWCLVLDPRPAPPAYTSFATRAALTMLVMFPQILIGALIAFAQRDIYTFYDWCGRLYPSVSAIDDQQYGGMIVWIPSAMMSVVALIVVINFLRQAEEKQWSEEDTENATGPIIASAPWTGR